VKHFCEYVKSRRKRIYEEYIIVVMPSARNVYRHADELEGLSAPNRENYLYETRLLQQELPQNATVLQVGSMDGMRIIWLLEVRLDLSLTGLEVESSLIKIAEKNITSTNRNVKFVTGDIPSPTFSNQSIT